MNLNKYCKYFIALCLYILPLVAISDDVPCWQYFGSRDDYLETKTIYGYVFNELKSNEYKCSVDQGAKAIKIYNTNTNQQEIITASGKEISSLSFGNFYQASFLQGFRLRSSVSESGQIDLMVNTIFSDFPLLRISRGDIVVPSNPFSPSGHSNAHISESCAMYPLSPKSQLMLNFSGRMFQCVHDSMNDLFFDNAKSEDLVLTNSFHGIVGYLKQSILALVILYVIGFGVNVLMQPAEMKIQQYIIFVMKAICVIYFTIGFNFSSVVNNKVDRKTQNGITDIALPILTSLSSDLSQIVFNATKSSSQGVSLCEFDSSKYESGYSYYALFDAIDCRVGYLLGYGLIFDAIANNNAKLPDDISSGGLLIFKVLFALLISSPVLFILNILFIYFFLSALLVNFVGHYIAYFIFTYIMLSLSPLFIPMILFKKTQSMFHSWFRVTLSFALQPVILAVFMTIMFSIYDQALYADCVFTRKSFNGYTTFDISSHTQSCSDSYGYQLYKLYTSDDNWGKMISNFLSFDMITAEAKFIPSAFQALLISYIIYKFAFHAATFAAQVTGGVGIELMQRAKASPKNSGDGGKGETQDMAKGVSGGASDLAKGSGAGEMAKGASGASDMVKRG